MLVTALALWSGYTNAQCSAKVAGGRTRGALFLVCLIPLWVSDLIRVFGWILQLRETGVVSSSLQALGLIEGPVELLYNDVTVVIGQIGRASCRERVCQYV